MARLDTSPRFMDVCAVFHPQNPVLVEKMVASVLKNCPKYESDMSASASVLKEALQKTEESLSQLVKSMLSSSSTLQSCDTSQVWSPQLESRLPLVT